MRLKKIPSIIAFCGEQKIFNMDGGGWMEWWFHCRIKIEFFLYDLMKFTFIFWGIEKEEKHKKMKRKTKRAKKRTNRKIGEEKEKKEKTNKRDEGKT